MTLCSSHYCVAPAVARPGPAQAADAQARAELRAASRGRLHITRATAPSSAPSRLAAPTRSWPRRSEHDFDPGRILLPGPVQYCDRRVGRGGEDCGGVREHLHPEAHISAKAGSRREVAEAAGNLSGQSWRLGTRGFRVGEGAGLEGRGRVQEEACSPRVGVSGMDGGACLDGGAWSIWWAWSHLGGRVE